MSALTASFRDPNVANLMMSADKMYPDGFHPADITMRRDYTGTVKAARTRAQCWPRYYLIDFERSVHFPPDYQGIAFNSESDQVRTPAQNPFPEDIHYLGQFMQTHFLDVSIFL